MNMVIYGMIWIIISYALGCTIGYLWGRDIERRRHADHD